MRHLWTRLQLVRYEGLDDTPVSHECDRCGLKAMSWRGILFRAGKVDEERVRDTCEEDAVVDVMGS